ncbi:putative membrane protein [Melghirimyces profundicolus]|uniref:Putative membrane protein n=1 Tax=Melghirimyces profundicolus TaxID=1242148 RepID=A0A2T6BXD8_9BACL|nr:cytochrome c oxidase assembly protein [Melghirimyces profundicolus]PTX60728.1 putative membrane protein [Melghirimyces profundicolus]
MHHHHASHDPFDVWNLVHPPFLLFVLAIGALYFILTGPMRREDLKAPTTKQKFLFLLGLILYYVAGGPVHSFGQLLFSAHMTEMSLQYLLVPPLVLAGLPSWVFRPLFGGTLRRKVFSFLTHPLITLFSFNGLISLYHIPMVFDTIMASAWWMGVSHLVLTVVAFMMWWPIVCPLPERDRLSPLKKMAYIFADGVLLTPACAIIAFSDTLMYEMYRDAPQVFAFLGPLDDQSLGGVVMKIIQEIAYGSVLGFTFFQWVRKQREADKAEQEETAKGRNSSSPACGN